MPFVLRLYKKCEMCKLERFLLYALMVAILNLNERISSYNQNSEGNCKFRIIQKPSIVLREAILCE